MGLADFSEGDYIQTIDGLFFAVKGGVHSVDLVVAILRYISDVKGERLINGIGYHRVYDIDLTTRYLKENFRDYINYVEWLGLEFQSVPTHKIAKVYKPTSKLQEILAKPKSKLEQKIASFISVMSTASGVDVSSFGVSGSLLIGLETVDSDIDINVYGKSEGLKIYDALRKLRKEEDWISAYDKESIEPVLVSRWGDTGLELEKFRPIECSKVLHGLIDGTEYFIRLLVDEEESSSVPLGSYSISATITDSSLGIYTPCLYRIDDVLIDGGSEEPNISELKSYRGKYTEQVIKGDRVLARGNLEKVNPYGDTFYRLILGQRGDYLLPT